MKKLGCYDLVIAGGGTAGSAAGITAGRLGMKVLIVEPLSCLGGTSTAGLVTPMMGNHLSPEIPLNAGLTKELVKELESLGQGDDYFFNPVFMAYLLEKKAIEARADILYESIITEVIMTDSKVTGVRIATRRGIFEVNCKTLIDATGDAQVSALAGVEVRQGREGTAQHQPMSLRFVMGNLDLDYLCEYFLQQGGSKALNLAYERIVSGDCSFLKEYAKQEGWPQKWLDNFGVQFFKIPSRPRELWFNCPRISGYDPLDPQEISKAYIEGRQCIEAYVKLFQKYVKGAENAYLVMTAPQIGLREGRRIAGKYTLTSEDFLNAAKFDDGICMNRYPIDIHRQNSSGVEWVEMKPDDWHEIPFRCLIPQHVQSLAVAGRCISSDFIAQASYRIIPNCHTLGQAATVGAYIAHKENGDISEVSGRKVREFMLNNAMLPQHFSTLNPEYEF